MLWDGKSFARYQSDQPSKISNECDRNLELAENDGCCRNVQQQIDRPTVHR